MSLVSTYCSDVASTTPQPTGSEGLDQLAREIAQCRRCPRLVDWREQVARERRAAYRDEEYWGRPVPGFGDPEAPLLVLGLAPAAHGANRTGRIFTGDRSGDWLYRALHRAGLANQATSVSRDDGLALNGVWVTSALRCAPPQNRPTPEERLACTPFLVRELELLSHLRAVLCLGAFAWNALCDLVGMRPRPRFGHGAQAEVTLGEGDAVRLLRLVGSFHPSQQNTFTGRLTETMLDEAVSAARGAAGLA
jgi:uracil-DNA glycosylase family 4